MPDSVVGQDEPQSIPPAYEYSWDFDYGLGPWTTWMAPSVVHEAGGLYENFTRLNAPGGVDPNHQDGIGALRLVAHLSIPTVGSSGILNLTDAEFQITIRGTDFQANGAKLMVWLCRYIPEEGVFRNYYVGLTVTNWANTGNDLATQLTDQWQTLTVRLSSDPADWTYAGNNVSQQGDWGDRYQPYDLGQTLASTDATLHLVMVSDEPDQAPTGFLDIANITVRTHTPAGGRPGTQPEIFYGLEDQATTGTLDAEGLDPGAVTFTLVDGSTTKGAVSIDPTTGAFVFTPETDFYGPTDYVGNAGFRYTVSDGVTTVERRAFLFIGGVNDAPTSSTVNEAVDVAFNEVFAFSLFKGQDVDIDERLTFHLVDGSATNGTVVLDAANGRYVFTPTAGFVGQASFTYYVSDGQAGSAPKTVVLNVHSAASPPPVVTYDQAVDFLIAGDIETFAYHVIRLAQAGDTNAAYHYGAFLAGGRMVARDTALAAEYLALAAATVPDAKLMLADLYVSGDGVDRDYVMARSLLTSLPDSATALYRLALLENLGFGGPRDDARAVELFLEASMLGSADAMYSLGRRYLMGEGVAVSPSDAYFWLGVGLKLGGGPNIPQFDNLLTFNMQQAVDLGLSASERAALDDAIAGWTPGQSSPVNDAPVGGDESAPYAGAAGQPITGVLAEATDPDGDPVTYHLVEGSAQHGVVTIDPATGAFVFTPAGGYTGPAEFRYVVFDGQAASADVVVNLAVEAAPGASADAGSVVETGTLEVSAAAGLLSNDTGSSPAGVLSVSAVNGQPANVGQAVAGAWGSVIIRADGGYVFVASLASAGLAAGQTATDSFTYDMTDDQGVTTTATLTVSVTGVGGGAISGDGVLIGTALGDYITGGTGADTIVGQAGDDIIDAGAGAANEVYGGLGDDLFVVSVAGDTVIEAENEGTDTVLTALDAYTLRDHVENLTFTGTGAFAGAGTDYDNVIRGGASGDVLSGLGGDDTLVGGGGADTLDGGAGFDTASYATATAGVTASLRAQAGSRGDAEGDTLVGIEALTGSAFDDVLSGGAGANTLDGGAGRDTVDYSGAAAGATVRLNNGVASSDGDGSSDVLIGFENATGSAFNDILIGSAEANLLSGGLGADVLIGLAGDDILIGGAGAANTMQGGLGDDRYVVSAAGDSLIELAGEGIDTVDTDLAAYVLRDHLENLLYGGSGDFAGTGNGADNVITGGAGDDVLAGRGGDDLLVGGAGLDTASYAEAVSAVRAQLNTGRSTQDGDGGTDAFSGIENLTGSAFADVLIGDAGTNVLRGGAGGDVLIGLAGDDVLMGGGGAANVLQGGLGDDRYVLEAPGDTAIEFEGEGLDTVETLMSGYTLRDHFENLTYLGAAGFVGAGNGLNNVITGAGGDDTLTGGGGNDTLNGGAGVDTVQLSGLRSGYTITYHGGGSATVVDTTAGDGTDILTGVEFLRFQDGSTLELSTLPVAASVAPVDKVGAGPQILPPADLEAPAPALAKGDGGAQVMPGLATDPYLDLAGPAHRFVVPLLPDTGAPAGEIGRLFEQPFHLPSDEPLVTPPPAQPDPDWMF